MDKTEIQLSDRDRTITDVEKNSLVDILDKKVDRSPYNNVREKELEYKMDKDKIQLSKRNGIIPDLAKNSLKNVFDTESKVNLYKNTKSVFFRLVSPSAGRNETFEEAVSRQKLTEEHLKAVLRQTKFESRFFYIASALSILLGIYYSINEATLAAISAMCISIMFACYAAPRAMRYWQINNKSMCSFKSWINNPENWFV